MLTRIRHLEKHVLHHVAAVRPLEFKLLSLEEDVIETPDRRRQHRGNALLALQDLESQVDGTLAGITRSP